MYFDRIHPLYYSFFFLPLALLFFFFFFTIFNWIHYFLFIHAYNVLQSYSFPPSPSPFALPPPTESPSLKISTFLHSCHVIWFCFEGLDSAYERKHVIFVYLSLAHFISHDDLQFDSFSCKRPNFILLYG
jgi:hypothetical protein